MSVKSTLKTVKLNESMISMFLGAVVIVISGLLILNYFRRQDAGTTLPTGEVTEAPQTNGDPITRTIGGETVHTVQENDNLWKIAEMYYKSGYNWVDIAEANNLSGGNDVVVGQELLIPDVDSRSATVAVLDSKTESTEDDNLAQNNSEPTTTPMPTITPTAAATSISEESEVTQTADTAINGTTYTVVRGDTLWDIAVRAYGDGYRWTDIAEANELVNPNLIHSGNVFTIPRS